MITHSIVGYLPAAKHKELSEVGGHKCRARRRGAGAVIVVVQFMGGRIKVVLVGEVELLKDIFDIPVDVKKKG